MARAPVHTFSGGPFDPRLPEPSVVVGVSVRTFAGGFFQVQIADIWSCACTSVLTDTNFSLYTIPANGAPIIGQSETELGGPVMIYGAVLHILKNPTAGTVSGTTAPTVFTPNFGFDRTTFTDVGSSKAQMARTSSAFSLGYTNVSGVWTSPLDYATGSGNNCDIYSPSPALGSGVNYAVETGRFYLGGSAPWVFGMTVSTQRSGAGVAPLLFEGCVTFWGQMLPPLRTGV